MGSLLQFPSNSSFALDNTHGAGPIFHVELGARGQTRSHTGACGLSEFVTDQISWGQTAG